LEAQTYLKRSRRRNPLSKFSKTLSPKTSQRKVRKERREARKRKRKGKKHMEEDEDEDKKKKKRNP